MPKDIMVDLETLGVAPGCVILSIGAVEFDYETGELGTEFYVEINQQSCVNAGLKTNQSTVDWWKRQSLEAQKVLYATNEDNGTQLSDALTQFKQYLESFNDENIYIWGNGADFDQPILIAAYNAVNIPQPWGYYSNRCYRTLKNLRPEVPFHRSGTYHNALSDARSQAVHAMALLRVLTMQTVATNIVATD